MHADSSNRNKGATQSIPPSLRPFLTDTSNCCSYSEQKLTALKCDNITVELCPQFSCGQNTRLCTVYFLGINSIKNAGKTDLHNIAQN